MDEFRILPCCWKRKRVISGHSSFVTIFEIISLSSENLRKHRLHCFSVSIRDWYRWFWYSQQPSSDRSSIENCNKQRRVHKKLCLQLTKRVSTSHPIVATTGSNGPMRPSGDVGNKVPGSRPHDGRSCSPVNSNCAPEVTVLPILTLYINLILIARDV